MPKAKLFDEESEEEVEIKTENEYAKRYDTWREKEELHKLEQKYGSKGLSSDASESSDSEDESDAPPEESEEMETQFLKTLSLLKTKDPRIYDPNFKFFDEKLEKEQEQKPNEKALTFDDSDSDDDGGDIFTIEKKAEIKPVNDTQKSGTLKKPAQAGKLKAYLSGATDQPGLVEEDLAPLRALWSDPHISEGEAFLRDYILNKRYLSGGGAGGAGGAGGRDAEPLDEDERTVEAQRHFERAFNFRFEEPDNEYLKRFPRTVQGVRPASSARADRRAQRRERKAAEKRAKMEDVKRMRHIKLKQIQRNIDTIRQVTGNEQLAFQVEDLDGEFDPAEHDRRMAAIFDDQYYGDQADTEKPQFPELDDELEIEDWSKYEETGEGDDAGPHCEDQDFNMDADAVPSAALQAAVCEAGGRPSRRARRNKSKLAALLEANKDVHKFTPQDDTTYQQYMDAYYGMECEDVLAGGLATRFKYRQVEPNDYGLTVEEILLADDKELTQWVPLKKVVRHTEPQVERARLRNYRQRAADHQLKRKILPSLYRDLPQEPEIVVPVQETANKKRKKKNKDKVQENAADDNEASVAQHTHGNLLKESEQDGQHSDEINNEDGNNDTSEVDTESKTKKKKKKNKNKEKVQENDNNIDTSIQHTPINVSTESEQNGHYDAMNNEDGHYNENTQVDTNNKSNKKKRKKDKTKHENNIDVNDGSMPSKESKRKRHKSDSFIVESVESAEPSHKGSNLNAGKDKPEPVNNLKRKLDTDTQVPRQYKKSKTSNSTGKQKKAFNMKFKKKDKFKNNKQKQGKSDNPLGQLSDERLKAYGLNPKKYRSFLKYKKF